VTNASSTFSIVQSKIVQIFKLFIPDNTLTEVSHTEVSWLGSLNELLYIESQFLREVGDEWYLRTTNNIHGDISKNSYTSQKYMEN